jgi:hypothetical protein
MMEHKRSHNERELADHSQQLDEAVNKLHDDQRPSAIIKVMALQAKTIAVLASTVGDLQQTVSGMQAQLDEMGRQGGQ